MAKPQSILDTNQFVHKLNLQELVPRMIPHIKTEVCWLDDMMLRRLGQGTAMRKTFSTSQTCIFGCPRFCYKGVFVRFWLRAWLTSWLVVGWFANFACWVCWLVGFAGWSSCCGWFVGLLAGPSLVGLRLLADWQLAGCFAGSLFKLIFSCADFAIFHTG